MQSSLPKFRLRPMARALTMATRTVAVFGAGLVICAPASAANFSQMVFFGDSLTDSGYFTGVGKQPSFTTNPDPVWAQIVAHKYGTTANPAAVLTPSGVQAAGGTDYAVGGARVTSQNGWPDAATAPLVPTVTSQVQGYLAANPRLDSKGLYAVWAGANDIFGYTQTNIAGLLNPATQTATAVQTIQQVAGEAGNVVGLVKQLQQAGAGTVIVINLPDVGRTPEGSAIPALSALWTAASTSFNASLNSGLSGLGGNIVALNAFGLLHEVIANPGLYGFTNVSSPACTTSSSGDCTAATLVAPNADKTYLFADGVHPTGAGHAILAQYIESVLQAPGQIGMLAEAPLAGTQTFTRVIDDRLRLTPRAGQVEAYAAYDNTHQSLDHNGNNPGLDGSSNSLSVGVDYAVNQNVTVGGAFGFAHNRANFGSDTGGFKLDQAMLSAYTQYRDGAWALNGIGMVGSLQYKDVTRNIALGATTRSETGSANGHQFLLRIGGQYDVDLGAAVLSPVGTLTWQQVNVGGYMENGNDSTAMNFQSQKRNSLVSSLGAQVSSKLALGKYTVQPFAKLAWEKEFEDSERDVRANVVGMAGSFGLPAYLGPSNSARLELGASIALATDFSAYASYSGQFAGGNKTNSFQVGLKKAF
ncbi:outer membrane lipase/esterase [Collimonas sp. OK607]|uniref:autotransporter outer membrane beta-barrel domain-containing protein n=1 Tax=Collimonas sp. OK607 TaxID=1798194 RepID=UPI0008E3A39C|nr:autotransporter domain-containing protein [Collimonas sp. OK607]SFB07798.1 outer membrane lipase/esterase [Collimonas sp. OK607]